MEPSCKRSYYYNTHFGFLSLALSIPVRGEEKKDIHASKQAFSFPTLACSSRGGPAPLLIGRSRLRNHGNTSERSSTLTTTSGYVRLAGLFDSNHWLRATSICGDLILKWTSNWTGLETILQLWNQQIVATTTSLAGSVARIHRHRYRHRRRR
uniref:Uncharacterized protein n=1 Tax=Physcomitrium patens TaxID=3218 RepID=A0A2K1J9J7_PHYPA|nr:hypothetical protein PHYPA_021300 [Physcomitrium patens]